MWLTFTIQRLVWIIGLSMLAGFAMGIHSETCHSATITIQAGQSAPQGKRDEQTAVILLDGPLMGSVITTFGQMDLSRLAGTDGLELFGTTDYAIVYDGRATTPEVSTWWMMMTGGLLIGAKLMNRRWAAVKARRVFDHDAA